MEFMNRGSRPPQPVSAPTPPSSSSPNNNNVAARKKASKGFFGFKLASVALLFSLTVLLIALLWFVVLGSPSSEGKYVDDSKLQAVFLNGGQVYFGKIKDMNNSYLRVIDIYYLRVNQQVQPDQENQQTDANDISLVKLGCELHGPQDEMLINRDQVVFWENLKSDGQVAEAVAEFKKQNPNGQDCEALNQGQNETPTTPSTEGDETE